MPNITDFFYKININKNIYSYYKIFNFTTKRVNRMPKFIKQKYYY